MKKWRNKILSAVLVLSLLLTSSSFAFAVDGEDTTESSNLVKITSEEIAALTPSSQQESAGSTIDKAFDGNTTGSADKEMWHTAWTTTNDTTTATGYKRSVKIELDEAQWISKIIYYPRSSKNNGLFKTCEIYASNDGVTWGDPIFTNSTNPWNDNDNSAKTMTFEPVYTKYILIHGKETYGDSKDVFASAAEIELYKDTTCPIITAQSGNQFGSQATLSVTVEPASGSFTYQWYTVTNGEETLIPDATGSTYVAAGNNGTTGYLVKVTDTDNRTVTSDVMYVYNSNENFEITKDNGLSIHGYSSAEGGSPADNAIDGNSTTLWHSNYDNGNYDNERYISVNLGNEYYLSKIRYLPRPNNSNGRFEDCEIYTSLDGQNWTLAKSVHWEDNGDWKEVFLDEKIRARYVKLVGVNTYTNSSEPGVTNKYATAAEIEFYADTTISSDIITQQPTGGSVTVTNGNPNNFDLTVTAAADSTFQWYSNDEKSYVNATEISSATTNTYSAGNETKYYFVKVTNNGKSVYSDIVLVKSTEAKIIRNGQTVYYQTLNDAKTASQTGETIYIMRDIEVSSTIEVSGAKSITITGENGDSKFTVKRSEGFTGAMFKANNASANVTFKNVIIDGGAVWGGTNNETLGRGTTNSGITAINTMVRVESGSTVKIGAGAVLQNNYNNDNNGYTNGGGAVLVIEASKLIIDGGEIKNNYCSQHGGAILARSTTGTQNRIPTVEFISGIISNNSAGNSAALCLDHNTTFTMGEDAVISNNVGGNGGAIWASNGTLDIAGEISGNSATNGGAIYMSGGCTVNLGNCTITGNTATANGSAIHYGNGTLNITGKITMGEDQVIYRGGSRIINWNTSEASEGKIYFTPADTNADSQIGVLNDSNNAEAAVNSLVYKGTTEYITYVMENNNIMYGEAVGNVTLDNQKSVMLNNNGEAQTVTLTANVDSSAKNVTYKWYKCSTRDGVYEEISGETGDTLTIRGLTAGTTYYYCEALKGKVSSEGPKQSNICEVKVSDFYPCSKAIEKFKNL